MREFCPNCQLRTIIQNHCIRCSGFFGTGYLVNRKRPPIPKTILPTSKDLVPLRMPHMLRDSGRIKTITFGKGLFPERRGDR